MQDLADRIARLERSNRRLRTGFIGVCLAFAVVAMSGADKVTDSKFDKLQANELTVGGLNGSAAATLTANKAGVALRFHDGNGRNVGSWKYTNTDGSRFRISNSEEIVGLTFGVENQRRANTNPGDCLLIIESMDGKNTLEFLSNKNGAGLMISDPSGKPRVRLGSQDNELINVIK